MQTYAYEVIVHADEKSRRKASVIAFESGLLEEPTKEDLLVEYAGDIKALGAKGSEVSVNVRGFRGW